MLKIIYFFLIISFSNLSLAEENLLTLKQQLDRLQREVNDLSKIVYGNNSANNDSGSDEISSSNVSAFDMRIYDIEKDIKSLNSNIENIIFEMDEIKILFEEYNLKLNDLIINNNPNPESSKENEKTLNLKEKEESVEENTLGTLKITSEDLSNDVNENNKNTDITTNIILSPDEEFQNAFDLLRSQKFDQAKTALESFIDKNPDSELSGSAHYWLGEIYLLKKDYREAALIFAEGYQKYPNSLKVPDILYKLAEALSQIDKQFEACNTLSKFKKDFGSHKLIDNINTLFQELKCEE